MTEKRRKEKNERGRGIEIRQTDLLAEYQGTMGEKMERRQNYDNIKILWKTEKKWEDEIESICSFLFFF